MTTKELARELDGIEYCDIKSVDYMLKTYETCKEEGFIVIYGYSEDLVEVEGLLYEELDAWNGCVFAIVKPGTMVCVDEYENHYEKVDELSAVGVYGDSMPLPKNSIEAIWCDPESDYPWTFATEIPHEKFSIVEEGEPFCMGIIIDVADLLNEASDS